jgi:hypothetical protein
VLRQPEDCADCSLCWHPSPITYIAIMMTRYKLLPYYQNAHCCHNCLPNCSMRIWRTLAMVNNAHNHSVSNRMLLFNTSTYKSNFKILGKRKYLCHSCISHLIHCFEYSDIYNRVHTFIPTFLYLKTLQFCLITY